MGANPYYPAGRRLLNANEQCPHLQAQMENCKLYKKQWVIGPVSATLETMWQAQQKDLTVKIVP